MRKQPFSVSFLAVVVLTFTAFNMVRFISALQSWELLSLISPEPGPAYIAITGAFWVLVGIILMTGLFHRQYWTPITLANCVGLYTIYFWLDRNFIQQKSLHTNDSFIMGVTVILFTVMLLAVSKSKKFFV